VNVIDKRFLGCRLLCCGGARATAWRRAGFEVRALPRSHYCRARSAPSDIAGASASPNPQPLHRLARPFCNARFLPRCGWRCKLAGMPPNKIGKLAPVTLGHMRSQGCRDLLVYCNSDRCNHSRIMNVGHLPDETPIKSLGDGSVCAKCGHLGADAVPNWQTHAATHSS